MKCDVPLTTAEKRHARQRARVDAEIGARARRDTAKPAAVGRDERLVRGDHRHALAQHAADNRRGRLSAGQHVDDGVVPAAQERFRIAGDAADRRRAARPADVAHERALDRNRDLLLPQPRRGRRGGARDRLSDIAESQQPDPNDTQAPRHGRGRRRHVHRQHLSARRGAPHGALRLGQHRESENGCFGRSGVSSYLSHQGAGISTTAVAARLLWRLRACSLSHSR